MTQSEFIKQYCKNSNISEEKLNELGRFSMICNCEQEGCEGWQMVSLNSMPYEYSRT